MSDNRLKKPDYVFEVSWEVCHKVGGIHTVVSTKAPLMVEAYGEQFIMIGPDLYQGEEGNPEFIEDNELHKVWREQSDLKGLKVRIGRWDIPSKPLTILIDYTPLFAQKNEIFAELWTKNHLDSLKGEWDYIEPTLFGYAAGIIIESFMVCHLKPTDKIIAQFHEWLTGAGVLYLENTVPEVATVFTTHATVAGRAIAGRGLPFYSNFETYNGDSMATEFNAFSKHSLEKTAAITADCFTTVSNNTARECQQLLGKAVDTITSNGFNDSFVPDEKVFKKSRKKARERLIQVASAVVGEKVSPSSLLVATSGRYEYKNKGLDLFIDALVELDQKEDLKKDVVAFILVPAANTGARKEVVESMETGDSRKDEMSLATTHYLADPDHDAIWQQIKTSNLDNKSGQKVKIVYAPIYLDGKDGVFNSSYYDLLIGFDLTAFPSYYEPFGYTPLESLAFHVPTITTSLTGFGAGNKSNKKKDRCGMLVIERSDFNDQTVVDQIANHIYDFSLKSNSELEKAQNKAFEISRTALWQNLIKNYHQTYELAMQRYAVRAATISRIIERPPEAFVEPAEVNDPDWKSLLVEFKVPDALKDLETLSVNLWWSWNHQAIELFKSIDEELWDKVNHNPIRLLHELPYNRLHELEKDADFMERLKHVMAQFSTYMNVAKPKSGPKIAYLCMEYGLHASLPMYSGGLGILAGDHLKEASDKNIDLLGIGLIYRYGYFNQSLTLRGDQVASYDQLHFTQLPIHPVKDKRGNRLIINVPLRGPMLYVQVWRLDVGRVPLYLFDTDIPENNEEYRAITHQLYGGDQLNRFRQELLIALCSITLFKILKIDVDLFHYNEGHTAFTGLARILQMVGDQHLSFDEAAHFAHASTLFTTHTPVPAGHDAFSEDILRSYHGHFAEELNVSWEQLLSIGKLNRLDPNEKFSMSYYAARSSEEINGVSKVHAAVTRKMFKPIWKGFFEEELKIDYVTNGAHYQTWAAPAWQQLFEKIAGNNFLQELSKPSHWEKIKEVPDEEIWEIRKDLKNELIKGIGQRQKVALQGLHTHPKQVYEMLHNLKGPELIIGFARRFASYKRGNLLFWDTERLKRIVNDPRRPVKIIFAGKAHPRNKEAQKLIKNIVKLSQSPAFLGKIFFVQNYDMELAQLMVKGVDVWLNTPLRGMEASGTSGMKATFNGVLNFSVMDGWWAEAYQEDAGWALPMERVYEKQKDQDDLDAEMIYNILEHEIIPEYYELDNAGVPKRWINRIKNAMAHIAPHYTSSRMVNEYETKFYQPMHSRVLSMKANNYKATKDMAKWVNKMKREWPKISVVDVNLSNGSKPVQLGEKFQAEVTLDLNNLAAKDIGVELVFAKNAENGELRIKDVQELSLVEEKPHKVVYRGVSTATLSGSYKYDLRFYPKNPQLHYRRVLPLVKWI